MRTAVVAVLTSTAAWLDRSQQGEPAEVRIYALFRGRRRRRDLRLRSKRNRRLRRIRAMATWWLARAYRLLVRLGLASAASVAAGGDPWPLALAGALLLPCELALTGGLALGNGWLLARVPRLERLARLAVPVAILLAAHGAVEVAGWPLPLFSGSLAAPACAGPKASIEVRDREAFISINCPAVLRLPVNCEQGERLVMVLCRHLLGLDGKPLLSLWQIAVAFGKKHKQHVQNHMQQLRAAGGDLIRMIREGCRGRPRFLHPEVSRQIAQHWQRDPLASIEGTCQWLAAQQLPPDVPLPTPEELGRQTRIEGNLIPIRNAMRRLLDAGEGAVAIRERVLVDRLVEQLDKQDRLLRDASRQAPQRPGIVEMATDRGPSGRLSRTGTALLAALRTLTSAVSAEQDEHLAATVGESNLAPLHFSSLYNVLRLSIGQVAALVRRSKSVVYRGLVSFERVLTALDPFPAAANFSGILGLDEKWLKIPKSFSTKEKAEGKKWRYAHFAVDAVSGDLLHVDVYEASDTDNIRAFLTALRAKGIRPRAVVTDMLGSYGKAIEDTFGKGVTHHYCLFHHLQAVRHRLREKCGPEWDKQRLLRTLVGLVDNVYACKTRRTAKKRLAKVLALREELARSHPDALPLLDIIEERFPLVVNFIGRKGIPTTNNVTERVIRAFNQHYKTMAGLESIETARIQLRLFRFFYRLTPMWDTARREDRGKCPLERAGCQVRGIPIADYVRRFSRAWEEQGPDLLVAPGPIDPRGQATAAQRTAA